MVTVLCLKTHVLSWGDGIFMHKKTQNSVHCRPSSLVMFHRWTQRCSEIPPIKLYYRFNLVVEILNWLHFRLCITLSKETFTFLCFCHPTMCIHFSGLRLGFVLSVLCLCNPTLLYFLSFKCCVTTNTTIHSAMCFYLIRYTNKVCQGPLTWSLICCIVSTAELSYYLSHTAYCIQILR